MSARWVVLSFADSQTTSQRIGEVGEALAKEPSVRDRARTLCRHLQCFMEGLGSLFEEAPYILVRAVSLCMTKNQLPGSSVEGPPKSARRASQNLGGPPNHSGS